MSIGEYISLETLTEQINNLNIMENQGRQAPVQPGQAPQNVPQFNATEHMDGVPLRYNFANGQNARIFNSINKRISDECYKKLTVYPLETWDQLKNALLDSFGDSRAEEHLLDEYQNRNDTADTPTRISGHLLQRRGTIDLYSQSVIGVIDCTHIAIAAPPAEDEEFPGRLFINRKGYKYLFHFLQGVPPLPGANCVGYTYAGLRSEAKKAKESTPAHPRFTSLHREKSDESKATSSGVVTPDTQRESIDLDELTKLLQQLTIKTTSENMAHQELEMLRVIKMHCDNLPRYKAKEYADMQHFGDKRSEELIVNEITQAKPKKSETPIMTAALLNKMKNQTRESANARAENNLIRPNCVKHLYTRINGKQRDWIPNQQVNVKPNTFAKTPGQLAEKRQPMQTDTTRTKIPGTTNFAAKELFTAEEIAEEFPKDEVYTTKGSEDDDQWTLEETQDQAYPSPRRELQVAKGIIPVIVSEPYYNRVNPGAAKVVRVPVTQKEGNAVLLGQEIHRHIDILPSQQASSHGYSKIRVSQYFQERKNIPDAGQHLEAKTAEESKPGYKGGEERTKSHHVPKPLQIKESENNEEIQATNSGVVTPETQRESIVMKVLTGRLKQLTIKKPTWHTKNCKCYESLKRIAITYRNIEKNRETRRVKAKRVQLPNLTCNENEKTGTFRPEKASVAERRSLQCPRKEHQFIHFEQRAATTGKLTEDEESQLIHESHYWLNQSKFKYAAIGYSPREGMMPIVKIGGLYGKVSFIPKEFEDFLNFKQKILEYFAQPEDKPAELFEGIEIQFILFKFSPLVDICKGQNAVLLAKQSLDTLWEITNLISYRLELLKSHNFSTYDTTAILTGGGDAVRVRVPDVDGYGSASKMYSVKIGEDKIKKGKGVVKDVVKNTITFKHYVKCLSSNERILREQNLVVTIHGVYIDDRAPECSGEATYPQRCHHPDRAGGLFGRTQTVLDAGGDLQGPDPPGVVNIKGLARGFYWWPGIDSFTKYPFVYIMKDIKAKATINVCREILAAFGLPKLFVTDNCPTFTSYEFKRFLSQNGTILKLIAPYHPATNGQAQRFVQTLKKSLLKLQSVDIWQKKGSFKKRSKRDDNVVKKYLLCENANEDSLWDLEPLCDLHLSEDDDEDKE
ncbi:hypothetical protein ILUMI_02500 [Ignelater luminosus]|uniref:Integrase catalytic domain-containing protein n=1 Tax=Ignelater luminosus TaxID=2038154 RepID=A0A8K0DHI6_IGNLU|nr:hypothetical protein ILUMI_02500 [Ignelater luminosus]